MPIQLLQALKLCFTQISVDPTTWHRNHVFFFVSSSRSACFSIYKYVSCIYCYWRRSYLYFQFFLKLHFFQNCYASETLVFFDLLCKNTHSSSSHCWAQIILYYIIIYPLTFITVCSQNQHETYMQQTWRWWAGFAERDAGPPQAPPTPRGHDDQCEKGRWPGPAVHAASSTSPDIQSPDVPLTAS